eukprot:g8771.t1
MRFLCLSALLALALSVLRFAHTAMPQLSTSRLGALERLREVKRLREVERLRDASWSGCARWSDNVLSVVEEEEQRLDAILKRIEERRQRMEDLMEDMDYLELQKLNVFNVSSYYINYDGEFQTKRMSAMLFSELAEESGYLNGEQRKQLFAPDGFVNTGFLTEGPLPTFGSWPTARPLSSTERARLHTATACLQQRLEAVDAAGRLHDKPYEFETGQTLSRCYAHVRSLMDGPLATEVTKSELPADTWTFPYFGLGQKWDESSSSWTKTYMKAIRRLLAAMGIAVAPEKCFTADYGEVIELLGINFLPEVARIMVALPEKKAKSILELISKITTKVKRIPNAAAPLPQEFYTDLFHLLEEVFKQYGWKLPEQLKPDFFATKRGKISNHYNGTKRKVEKYEKYEEDYNAKRPRAPNVVPKFYSQQWPMPDHQTLFLFPEEGPSLMSEGGLGQLQSLTFDNLNRYSQLFEPARANPPDLTRVPLLALREQRIFGMWSVTGLRKCSFASIRKDCLTTSEDQRFVKAMIPPIKSLPVPGEHFFAYIPKDIFFQDVFPVTPMELDAIAHKLHTTSHGVRRALALQLRRRCAEVGLYPDPDGRHSKEYLAYRQKVSDLFGWTCNSVMWEEVYSKDIAIHRSAKFSMRPEVDKYFTGHSLTTVIKTIKKTLLP